jgi:hypothetical protein
VVHNLHFSLHILKILLGDQFSLGNRLASKNLSSLIVCAQIGNSKLPTTKFPSQSVSLSHIFKRSAKHMANGRGTLRPRDSRCHRRNRRNGVCVVVVVAIGGRSR